MHPSRRDFLRQGLTAAGALSLGAPAHALTSRGTDTPLPPHREVRVPGVHAYASHESVFPGDEIQFAISTDTPVEASLCRLGPEVDDPSKDEVLEDWGTLPAASQPVHPGSYVHVPRGLRGERRALTVEAWVRPWRVDRLMGIVSQEDKTSSAGWALGVGPGGYVGFYLGDDQSEDDALVHRSPPGLLTKGRWHHVVAVWNGTTKEVWVDGSRRASWPFAGPLRPGNHPLRLGAMGEEGRTTRFLDGDLAQVAIYGRALAADEIAARQAEGGLSPPRGGSVLASWAFNEEKGDRIADGSRHRRHGRLVNHGTWMIGGPTFDAAVPRFGDYDPAGDPRRGHGLRLCSDDLYDCRWSPTLRWRVPASARSGMYVLRLRWSSTAGTHWVHSTFIVRRARRRRPAPILVLAATNTWRAYNAAAFGVRSPGLHPWTGTDGLPNSSPELPAFSFYRPHASGQGTYQLGSRMPWPAADPYLLYGQATRYSHLARADRFAQAWLERQGYEFEVITDHDLHREPDRLKRHTVFLINGHSEYWSVEMYEGLQRYLRGGGKAVVLSGNSLFWRVTYSDDGRILECRKVDAPGDQLRPEQRGEAWHSHDGRRGGMMRECGFPGWRLIGLETLGWNNQGDARNFGPWIADAADHPLFHTPEEVGVRPGDRFGWAGPGQVPMANGHEFDLRLSTLARMAAGPVPAGATMPDDPPGILRLANGVIPWQYGGAAFDYFFRPIQPANEQGGEMIWWERPDGGTVFNAGTIGAGWVLDVDERWARLLRNVLHRMGVPRPS